MTTIVKLVGTAGVLVMCSGAWAQAPFDDGFGREWRQLTDTVNLSWDQVAAVCPADGRTPGTGSAGGRDLTGWVWATRAQVRTMFARYEPALNESLSVGGPGHLLSALEFLSGGRIRPTFEYYTSFGGYLYTAGLLADRNPDGTAALAEISAEYPVFYGAWTVESQAAPATQLRFAGVWLWRWTADRCHADFNSDGFLDFFDYDQFVNCFETGACPADASADFNADGFVDFFDYDAFVQAFETGC
jgi:hypothetical protein